MQSVRECSGTERGSIDSRQNEIREKGIGRQEYTAKIRVSDCDFLQNKENSYKMRNKIAKKSGHMDMIENMYNEIPAFTDVFTEESFYAFVVCFVLATVLVAIILSRYITIKPCE